MPNRVLSRSRGDLKALYEMGGSRRRVENSEPALHPGVRPASATEMLSRLDGLGLAAQDRRGGAAPIPLGPARAVLVE